MAGVNVAVVALGKLLRRVAVDVALGQCLLQFSNLSLGEVGVVLEIQFL